MTAETIMNRAIASEGNKKNVTIADKMSSSNTHKHAVTTEEHRRVVEKFMRGIAEIPKNWSDMTVREQRDWMYVQISQHMPNLPKSLDFLLVASTTSGDCGRPASAARPDWLDHEKFLRGQRFAMNNLASVSFAELLSLVGLYSFEDGLKPLIITGKSSEPFEAFKRYLSTANRMTNWYNTDPWTEGTQAYKDIQIVRRMHALVRKNLVESSEDEIDRASKIAKPWNSSRSILLEDFRESCPAAAAGQCPYVFSKEEQHQKPKGLNQSEMAVTQSAFVCLSILYPEYCGIHGASDEDLDAFCHVWRSIGYLLGMEDEFNFCNGTLEEVKQRSRDFLEYWVKPNLRDITPEWEHMVQCLMMGVKYYMPAVDYKHSILYFSELLNIRLPRFEASLSYMDWISYKLMKMTLRWIARLPGIPAAMNRAVLFCTKRGFKYNQEKLNELKKHSSSVMSKGIEETAAAQRNLSTRIYTFEKTFPVFLLACLIILILSVIVKIFAQTFFIHPR